MCTATWSNHTTDSHSLRSFDGLAPIIAILMSPPKTVACCEPLPCWVQSDRSQCSNCCPPCTLLTLCNYTHTHTHTHTLAHSFYPLLKPASDVYCICASVLYMCVCMCVCTVYSMNCIACNVLLSPTYYVACSIKWVLQSARLPHRIAAI